jgi:hypothetical protein
VAPLIEYPKGQRRSNCQVILLIERPEVENNFNILHLSRNFAEKNILLAYFIAKYLLSIPFLLLVFFADYRYMCCVINIMLY